MGTDRRRNYLVNWFLENILATDIKKNKLVMNKPVDLGF